ncbi:MAG: winged helix-turn-helix domain-containing protein [Rubrivivax sp.]|nr:winged helix-turn-helix domain-containing protein [Rubrivivax sp.]
MSTPLAYLFGAFRLVPAQRVLFAGETAVKLGARALDMLVALVERRERVVGKDELLDVVWPGLVVEENNLQVQVVTLRKLLGHPAISTVPGRGYRFTLPVQLQGGDAPAPPPPPAPAPRVATPELVGRAAELEALCALVDQQAMVTVVGAGGIGKTRLAQAAAARCAARGSVVHWVDLAPLANAQLIPHSVGRAVGASVDGTADPARAVCDFLRGQEGLLVLDNAEHLVDGVAAFVEALRLAAPAVRLLVTSQELLRVAGEQIFRLPPLALPEDDADAETSGAVALFVLRAQAVDAGFRLGPDNRAGVVQICRRLDGLPLAIELAAGRVGLLGVDGLCRRLDERFRVLTAGARVALRRHQTLRATLEWSHGLLAEPEQAVFARLGCFVGGFTLEAAQAVAEDEAIDRWDVLEHLGSLVDKSLVLAEGSGQPRYRMLETTRLFALEQLAASGETESAMRRHALATGELLAASGSLPRRWTATPAQFVADAAEIDNARAALGWAAAASDGVVAVGVAANVAMAFVRADQMNEYLRSLLKLRERVGDDVPRDVAGRFWLHLARAGVKSASASAAEAAGHAVVVNRDLGDAMLFYEALCCALLIGANRAEELPLRTWAAEAQALEQAEWPPALRSFFRWAHYRSLRRAGDDEAALRLALEQGELSARRDPVFTLRLTGVNVVDCEIALGRFAEAEARARAALQDLRAAGIDDGRTGGVYEGLALALVMQGLFDEALPVAREAQRRLAADGDDLRLLEPLAAIALHRGHPAVAVRVLGHVDAALAAQGLVRWPAAARRRAQTGSRVAAQLPAGDAEKLLGEGAALSRTQAYALAFA